MNREKVGGKNTARERVNESTRAREWEWVGKTEGEGRGKSENGRGGVRDSSSYQCQQVVSRP